MHYKSMGTIFQENVRELFKRTGFTQMEVAQRGGFSQSGFSELLSYEDPDPNFTLAWVESVAKGLGVPAIWLLTDYAHPARKVDICPGHQVICGILPNLNTLQTRMLIDEKRPSSDALIDAIGIRNGR